MRTYEASGRNGYHAVDEYEGSRCIRTVFITQTSRVADSVAGALTDAYRHGRVEAIRGAVEPRAEALRNRLSEIEEAIEVCERNARNGFSQARQQADKHRLERLTLKACLAVLEELQAEAGH